MQKFRGFLEFYAKKFTLFLTTHEVRFWRQKTLTVKTKCNNEAKRFDPSERNFNFEFRSWATALSKFETLFLPLNLFEIQAFLLNFIFKFGFFR